MSLSQKIFRPGLVSLGIKICGVGIGMVIAIVLARLLGAADFGEYSYVLAIVTLLAIPTQLGLPNLVIRETARAQLAGTPEVTLAVWRWTHQLVALISIFSIFLLIAGFILLPAENVEFWSWFWAIPLLPLIALGSIRGAALRGLGKVNLGQLPEILLRPVFFLVLLGIGIFLSTTELSPARAMQFHALGALLAFLVGGYWLFRYRPRSAKHYTLSRETHRLWLKSAAVLGLVSGLQVFNANADLVMLGILRGTVDVGIYKVAMTIAGSATFVLASLNVVIMPQVVMLLKQGDRPALQAVVGRTARLSFMAALAITIALILSGMPLLRLTFGPEFISAYWPMLALLIGNCISAFFGPVTLVLNMAGQEKETLKGVMAGAAVNIALNFLLIPKFGGFGAAIASTSSLTIWNVFLFARTAKKLHVRCSALNS